MSGRQWAVVAAAALNVLLWAARPVPAAPAWLHPVAPPLTRIQVLGDATLGPPVPQSMRGSELFMAVERVVGDQDGPLLAEGRRIRASMEPALARSGELRLAVQDDAVDLARRLGPERVGLMLAERERLSALVGEGKVWTQLSLALGAP